MADLFDPSYKVDPARRAAIGSGAEYALGALDAIITTHGDDWSPTPALTLAIGIACSRDGASTPPVIVERLRGPINP